MCMREPDESHDMTEIYTPYQAWFSYGVYSKGATHMELKSHHFFVGDGIAPTVYARIIVSGCRPTVLNSCI